jgi:hypothetical protein
MNQAANKDPVLYNNARGHMRKKNASMAKRNREKYTLSTLKFALPTFTQISVVIVYWKMTQSRSK